MYPNGTPSTSMDNVWTDGDFRPSDVVRKIIDNVTPVNKNSARNSLGAEVSLVQNFINATNCGRTDVPIISGFFSGLRATNVYATTLNTTYLYGTTATITQRVITSGSYHTLNTTNIYSGILTGQYLTLQTVYAEYPSMDYRTIVSSNFIEFYNNTQHSILDGNELRGYNNFTVKADPILTLEVSDPASYSTNYVCSIGSIHPATSDTYFLGYSSKRWQQGYFNYLYSKKLNLISTSVDCSAGLTINAANGAFSEYTVYSNTPSQVIAFTPADLGNGQLVALVNIGGSEDLTISGGLPGAQSIPLVVGQAAMFMRYSSYVYPLCTGVAI